MSDNKKKIIDFEEKVSCALKNFGVTKNSIVAVGVSGGADSMSLLVSLLQCLSKSQIFVLTVNHNIRSEEESGGDANFVRSFCAKNEVYCRIHEIERGEIERLAACRGGGIEDAARELRYAAFEKFCFEINADFFCLAHNRNDQLETLVMRFLQGSSVLSGIPSQREKFIRPLLNISRSQIEEYLKVKKVAWRTDKTNFDESYFRNRVRRSVLPLFNELFPGWDGAALSGAKKIRDDLEFVDEKFEEYLSKTKSCEKFISVDIKSFCSASPSFKRRIVYALVDRLKKNVRLPFSIVETICGWTNETKNGTKIEAAGVSVFIWNNFLCADIIKNSFADCGFCVTIKSDCALDLFDLHLKICEEDCGISIESIDKKIFLKSLAYPFLLRSAQVLDKIKGADDSMRDLSKVLSSWKLSEDERYKIPLVQELQTPNTSVVAVLGGFIGTKDWIVEDWQKC